jgi:hypothetical protein
MKHVCHIVHAAAAAAAAARTCLNGRRCRPYISQASYQFNAQRPALLTLVFCSNSPLFVLLKRCALFSGAAECVQNDAAGAACAWHILAAGECFYTLYITCIALTVSQLLVSVSKLAAFCCMLVMLYESCGETWVVLCVA